MTLEAAAGERGGSWQRGILYALLMTLCFAALDASAKTLTTELHVLQIVWGRYFFHFIFFSLFVFAHANPRRLIATARLPLQAARSVLLVFATFAFWWGLIYLPLAQAVVIGFAGPLLVTALSVPLLKEPVGAHRWGAVIVGLIGVLVIIRPGVGVVHWAVVLPLATALFYAFYQIATRVLSRTDDALTTLFYTAVGGVVLTSLAVPFVWEMPTFRQWLMLAWMGFLGGFGHFLLIKAFSAAPASVLAPFSYSTLIWATALGYLLWGDLPDGWTIAGAAVIIASGLYIIHRERRRRVGPQR